MAAACVGLASSLHVWAASLTAAAPRAHGSVFYAPRMRRASGTSQTAGVFCPFCVLSCSMFEANL